VQSAQHPSNDWQLASLSPQHQQQPASGVGKSVKILMSDSGAPWASSKQITRRTTRRPSGSSTTSSTVAPRRRPGGGVQGSVIDRRPDRRRRVPVLGGHRRSSCRPPGERLWCLGNRLHLKGVTEGRLTGPRLARVRGVVL
jgi:hypothetical protein